ncbi:uncharacterized protein LOC122504047 [Leptopilina heterotoma]|uniref:uncharacterized protein LOC122504047 n=1 Tax=Leptopilina heterotoma TaxID=63436 RepID=UPI001CA7D4E8|nr:uncharacterized protein LOC122504047 [Leptopilina heterotoma]
MEENNKKGSERQEQEDNSKDKKDKQNRKAEILNKCYKRKSGNYRTSGRRLSKSKAARARRQRNKQRKLEEDFANEENVTLEVEMDECQDKTFHEDLNISFNNNENNNNHFTGDKVEEVSDNEIVLQAEFEEEDEAFEAMQEETVEIEEIFEEIEILEVEDEKDMGIDLQPNIKLKEGKEDFFAKNEEIKENEEDEEKQCNGLEKFVEGKKQKVILKVGQESNKEIENEALQEMKCLYKESNEIEEIYEEILINGKEDMMNAEEDDNDEDIEEEERDETEANIEEFIEEEVNEEMCIMNPHNDEDIEEEERDETEENIEELIEEEVDEEMCIDENEDIYENKGSKIEQETKGKSNEKKKFKNVKILDEFITQEREISMMTHVINETLKKVVEENNHKKGCEEKSWKIVSRYRKGLKTKYNLQCRNCGAIVPIWSEPESEDYLDINLGSALGTITAEIGYSTIEEALAAINVHYMSPAFYIKCRLEVGLQVMEISRNVMKACAKKEAEIAVAKGHVINGIPYITVIVDCAWSKRTYCTSAYDALGGCVLIIGYETNQIIDVLVRNIPCAICQRAMKEERVPREHECFSNYDEGKSSSRMESEMVVEGFTTSEEKYGLIYKYRIGDGDSSTDALIANIDPYEKHNVVVKKLECNNHKFRNFCNHIDAMTSEKSQHEDKNPGNAAARRILGGKKLKMRIEIITASDRRREDETLTIAQKIELLYQDIQNVASHCLGEHKNCERLNWPCKGRNLLGEDNMIPLIKNTQSYAQVVEELRLLGRYSESLLYKVTTNVVESANNNICKVISGKRICYNMKESYTVRCHAPAMQFTTKKVLSTVYEGMGKQVPQVVESMENRRKLKVENNKKYAQEKRRTKRYFKKNKDQDYGANAKRPDLPEDIYKKEEDALMDELQSNWEERDQIIERTKVQSLSDEWKRIRSKMLTASNFGYVARRQKTTLSSSLVKQILFNMVLTDAMQYGIDREQDARIQLDEKLGITTEICGFFIDPIIKFLGGSPDGLIAQELYDLDIPLNAIMNRKCNEFSYEIVPGGIVEIKCPYTARNMTIEEAKKKITTIKGMYRKDMKFIKTSHPYYYQVQGLLHCTRRKYCIFVMWTLVDMEYTVILRDDKLWSNIEKKLSDFYLYCMRPEIIDSRNIRHYPLREPEYILKAREHYKAEKEKAKQAKLNAILQKCIETEKIVDSDIQGVHQAQEKLQQLPKRKQDFKDGVQGTVKKRKTCDDWTLADVSNVDIILTPKKEKLESSKRSQDFKDGEETSLKEIILDNNKMLDDACIDSFIKVLQAYHPELEFLSTHNLSNPQFITPCTKNVDVQILGAI